MQLHKFAFFESAMPDDSVQHDGDIVVPGGRAIAEIIFYRLTEFGYMPANLDQHSHYGWSFDVRGGGGRFWLLLQCPNPWLLTVRDSRMPWTRLFQGKQPYVALTRVCEEILQTVPEFSGVRWLTQDEFEREMGANDRSK